MKHSWLLPTVGLLALAGCVSSQQALPTPPPMPRETLPVAPVRAEQVTSQSAYKLSQALADELDRDAQHAVTPPAPTAPPAPVKYDHSFGTMMERSGRRSPSQVGSSSGEGRRPAFFRSRRWQRRLRLKPAPPAITISHSISD
jgi:hypothetical protein